MKYDRLNLQLFELGRQAHRDGKDRWSMDFDDMDLVHSFRSGWWTKKDYPDSKFPEDKDGVWFDAQSDMMRGLRL